MIIVDGVLLTQILCNCINICEKSKRRKGEEKKVRRFTYQNYGQLHKIRVGRRQATLGNLTTIIM